MFYEGLARRDLRSVVVLQPFLLRHTFSDARETEDLVEQAIVVLLCARVALSLERQINTKCMFISMLS